MANKLIQLTDGTDNIFPKVAYETVRHDYSSKTSFTAGEYGYVDIPVNDVPSSANVVGLVVAPSHLIYGVQLTPAVSLNKDHIYVSYYSPVAFTLASFKIIAELTYMR